MWANESLTEPVQDLRLPPGKSRRVYLAVRPSSTGGEVRTFTGGISLTAHNRGRQLVAEETIPFSGRVGRSLLQLSTNLLDLGVAVTTGTYLH